MFFSPFSIAINLLWEERSGLCAFHAFVSFACDGLCLFPLPLDFRDWLQVVIVAILGLFFLPFIMLSLKLRAIKAVKGWMHLVDVCHCSSRRQVR